MSSNLFLLNLFFFFNFDFHFFVFLWYISNSHPGIFLLINLLFYCLWAIILLCLISVFYCFSSSIIVFSSLLYFFTSLFCFCSSSGMFLLIGAGLVHVSCYYFCFIVSISYFILFAFCGVWSCRCLLRFISMFINCLYSL